MDSLNTKHEYLRRLSQKLSSLPDNERQDAMEYYEDYINEAISVTENEAVAISTLPTPGEVAADILADYMSRSTVGMGSSFKEKRNGVKVALAVIVGMFALPIGLPLIITMGLVVFSLLLALGSVILALFLTGAGMVLSGIVVAFMMIFISITSLGSGVLALGYALLSIGVGILLIKACSLLVNGFAFIARGLSKVIVKRRVRI